MSVTENVARAFNFIRLRQRAYKLALGSMAGQQVLIDLAKFCRAAETCVVLGDSDRTLVLEGRREVWLRIQQHMRLNSEQLFALYSGKNYIPDQQGDNADG